MARFYLHLHQDQLWVRDLEGQEFPNRTRAIGAALCSARDLVAAAIKDGEPVDLDSYVSVEEEGGFEVARVSFRDAIILRSRGDAG